jgi:phospholipase A1
MKNKKHLFIQTIDISRFINTRKRCMKITFLLLFISFSVFSQTDSIVKESTKKRQNLKIRAYKPIYFLANYTSNTNQLPTSGNPNNVTTTPLNSDPTELKFQLSFKAKFGRIEKILGQKIVFDTWVGYTQSSRWQIFNTDESRPFRVTDYEPELFFTFPIKEDLVKQTSLYLGLGINHQSNGRSLPYSRSWNRVIFQLGYETKEYSILLKPWFRIQEDILEDDNPNIEDFVGRFDLTSAYKKGKNNLSVSLRHPLNFNNPGRGSFRIDYSYRVFGYLKLHTQIFHGYGENLLDYNYKQTTIGLGVSLIDWLDKF